MKIFLDTAGIDEIRTAARWGVLDGVTTNPSLFAKVGGSYDDVLKQICEITPGPVSAEVVADDVEGMLREGRHFAKLAPNIFVKVPMSEDGLEAIARLAEEGIKTNCTLIFSANQGLLAAKAGASLLSPFVGRLDDINQDGMEVVRELVAMVETYDLDTEVLAASIRSPRHMTEAALAGAHIATVPLKVLTQMIHHPLTDKGIVQFRQDWEAAQASACRRRKPPRSRHMSEATRRRGRSPRRTATDAAPARSTAIRLGETAADWRAAVRLAGDALVASGATTPAYTDEMVATVEQLGPYIVIAPGIALAHSRPSPAVLRAGISLVTLPRTGRRSGTATNDPVRLVIGLAAVDEEGHITALSTLAEFLSDETRRERTASELPTPAKSSRLVRRLRAEPGSRTPPVGRPPSRRAETS